MATAVCLTAKHKGINSFEVINMYFMMGSFQDKRDKTAKLRMTPASASFRCYRKFLELLFKFCMDLVESKQLEDFKWASLEQEVGVLEANIHLSNLRCKLNSRPG